MRRVASWIVLVIGLIPLWLVTMFFFGSRSTGWLGLIVITMRWLRAGQPTAE